MMDSIDGFVDGFVVPDVDGFIVVSNIKIVDERIVHCAFQYLQKNKDTNPIFTSSNFCHGWISRHNTINEYIYEAFNKYPDAVEIRINLGVNYFRYVKFNGSWHHSWDKSDLNPEAVLCVSEIKNLQRLIPLEKNVVEIQDRLIPLEKNVVEIQDRLVSLEKNEDNVQDRLVSLEKNEDNVQERLVSLEKYVQFYNRDGYRFEDNVQERLILLEKNVQSLANKGK